MRRCRRKWYGGTCSEQRSCGAGASGHAVGERGRRYPRDAGGCLDVFAARVPFTVSRYQATSERSNRERTLQDRFMRIALRDRDHPPHRASLPNLYRALLLCGARSRAPLPPRGDLAPTSGPIELFERARPPWSMSSRRRSRGASPLFEGRGGRRSADRHRLRLGRRRPRRHQRPRAPGRVRVAMRLTSGETFPADARRHGADYDFAVLRLGKVRRRRRRSRSAPRPTSRSGSRSSPSAIPSGSTRR